MAGPEAANNAASTGVLVPLLTLGIPTSATAAILLAAFQNYGIQPGPLLFETQPDLVWGLIASMYVGNVLLLVLNLPLIGIWVKVLTIPQPLLYAGILVFATLGAYSLHQSVVDLVTLYVFGLLGFVMRRWDFPVAPAVIGLILGPLAESQFRRALAISQGDLSVFFTHPISATLLALATALLVGAVGAAEKAKSGVTLRQYCPLHGLLSSNRAKLSDRPTGAPRSITCKRSFDAGFEAGAASSPAGWDLQPPAAATTAGAPRGLRVVAAIIADALGHVRLSRRRVPMHRRLRPIRSALSRQRAPSPGPVFARPSYAATAACGPKALHPALHKRRH